MRSDTPLFYKGDGLFTDGASQLLHDWYILHRWERLSCTVAVDGKQKRERETVCSRKRERERDSRSCTLAVTGGVNNQLLPRLLAVKSVPFILSPILQREKHILSHLQGCPHIITCFGDDADVHLITTDTGCSGGQQYNLFLEYLPGSTLADLLRRSPSGHLPETLIKRYTRSLLHGLDYIHAKGYVHCDVKPQNILLGNGGDTGNVVKMADFGLAKEAQGGDCGVGLRWTALYMAPESIVRGEYEAAVDVWALGCAVAEMATGRLA